LTLICKKGTSLPADALVLATGLPFKTLPWKHPAIIDIWSNFHQFEEYAKTAKEQVILIVGSGLTAVDALCTLDRLNYKGKILVVSSSGSFPQVHTAEALPKLKAFPIELPPQTALSLLQGWKQALNQHSEVNQYWRQLVDAVRPHIPSLWKKLEPKQKQLFLRHLFGLWNKHRHCMAPSSGKLIKKLVERGQLQLIKGKLKDVQPQQDGSLRVSFSNQVVIASAVINCIGPNYNFEEQTQPLIYKLYKNSLLSFNSLGLGLQPLPGHNFLIHDSPPIWTLGALLFGEFLETTAVPEIRHQAQQVATEIASFIYKGQ
jgi:uncharacterized NAD(P)/FAD-binding protein YdhS